MPKWSEFSPELVEYDFESDELHNHRVTIDEAVQCLQNDFVVRRNKKYKDRYKLLGRTDAGRRLCIIFQLKRGGVVRIITGWEA